MIGQLTTGTQRITSTYVENTDQVFKLISAMNGITSTYVENTKYINTHYWRNKDHLHIRGEYYQLPYFLWKNIGSPPHTWRIQDPNHDCMLQYRDHLHIRGEYQLKLLLKPQRRGSPPHVWRILSGGDPVEYLFRITSTYVENTLTWTEYHTHSGDHLHIRGEY